MPVRTPALLLSAALLTAAGCGGEKEVPAEVNAALDRDAPAAPAEQKTGIVGRKTIEVLDAPAALAAGTHTVAQGRFGDGPLMGEKDVYTDPVTGPLNMLGGMTGAVGRIGMQQWIDGEYALNGEYPTHARVVAFLEKNPKYALPMPRLSQRYGYDETTGDLVLLDVVGGVPAEGGSLDLDGDRLLPKDD